MNFLLLIFLMNFGTTTAPIIDAPDELISITQVGSWEHLGTRKVNRRLDRDIIPVTIRDGFFRKIKLMAVDGNINIKQCIIQFADGTKQIVEVRKTLKANQSTNVIDISGNRRIIDQVEFLYDTKGIKVKKAKIKLYGQH